MRWKLGSLVFGTLLVSLAISAPASGDHSCSHDCGQQYQTCKNSCSVGPACWTICRDIYEECLCGGCGLC
jgi:hypothetical protein